MVEPLKFPELMLNSRRYKEQVKSRKARPQVVKEQSGIKEGTAAKEALQVPDLRGAQWWNTGASVRTVPRFLYVPRITTLACVKVIIRAFFIYSSYHVPSMHIPTTTTPAVFYALTLMTAL